MPLVREHKKKRINHIPGVQYIDLYEDIPTCIHYLCTPTDTGCFSDEQSIMTNLFSELHFSFLQIIHK